VPRRRGSTPSRRGAPMHPGRQIAVGALLYMQIPGTFTVVALARNWGRRRVRGNKRSQSTPCARRLINHQHYPHTHTLCNIHGFCLIIHVIIWCPIRRWGDIRICVQMPLHSRERAYRIGWAAMRYDSLGSAPRILWRERRGRSGLRQEVCASREMSI
jgi:hypothetical protein